MSTSTVFSKPITKTSQLTNDSGFVGDVQVNGSSVVSNGTANIPLADSTNPGVVIGSAGDGIGVLSNGKLYLYKASSPLVKAGTESYKAIVPSTQHESTFYGLAKAAGDSTQASSDNAVGTYTAGAKTAIKTMLGITDPTVSDVQVNSISIINNGVANVPVADDSTLGVVKTSPTYGTGMRTDGTIQVCPASDAQIKGGTGERRPVAPFQQHQAVFYGLAKAAGDSTQSASDNAVGTYTSGAKTAIQTMLGVPGDVQVNGTSVVSNGVANIPVASSSNPGVVKVDAGNGLAIYPSSGSVYIYRAVASEVKSGTSEVKPIVPYTQDSATFYGLAKAAGDTTQSSSSNAVGTYTEEAKTSIRAMLGAGTYTKPSGGIPATDIASGVIPDISGKLDSSLKGANNGLAELDSSGKVPSSQLPSYVDDVVEYANTSAFPSTGESGKIYVALDTNKTYRWSGSEYVEISPSLALGETSSTAYRGDRGKSAYDHATESGKISSAVSSGLYKFSATAQGHIASTTAVQKSDITALGIPAQDTTYQSKVAASGGTDVSLVTTGEKYTWNSKYDKPSGGIPASDLASGVIPDVTGKADKTDTVLLTTLSRGRKENTTVGTGSFAFGLAVTASGNYSHAEGLTTTASGGYSHTEGNGSVASGNYSHAEGMATASGDQAHAEAISSASGSSSHAEGYGDASGMASHAEGIGHANGMFSHAEGNGSSANGLASHVEGCSTVADGAYSHVIGSYNVNLNSGTSSGNKGTHVEIVGNGTADDARSNAYALSWTGDGRYAGDVYVGCNTDSTGGTKLAKITDIPSVTGKADKVASATNGNFAALDSNGNLTDSGHKHSDYLASNTTYVSSVNGSSGAVTIPVLPTVSSSDNDKVLKVVSGAWAAATAPSGLPAVTSADNGKVLMVVNGAWAVVSLAQANGVSF